MPFRYPWTSPVPSNMDKVGLFSIGSLEEKIPFALYPILLSSDLALSLYKKFEYPRRLSVELAQEIKASLREANVKYILFDLRIHDWTNDSTLEQTRLLSRSLLDGCDALGIESSIVLSNGGQLLGKALGTLSEMIEASDVSKGLGPPDLTKFTLEIGADLVLMAKRSKHRQEAKKWLKDKIISGELSQTADEAFKQEAPFLKGLKRRKISSPTEGYVHHLEMNRLHSLKSKLASVHPAIGLFLQKKTGDRIDVGNDILEILVPEGIDIPIEPDDFRNPFVISDGPPRYQPFILERLGPNLPF